MIVAGFGALGWWDGSDWIMAEDAGALPVVGGEDYQIARIGLQAITTAGAQTLVCEPIGIIGVEVDNPELLGEWPGPYGVAISAPWERACSAASGVSAFAHTCIRLNSSAHSRRQSRACDGCGASIGNSPA